MTHHESCEKGAPVLVSGEIVPNDPFANLVETLQMIDQLSDFIAAAVILIVTSLPSVTLDRRGGSTPTLALGR